MCWVFLEMHELTLSVFHRSAPSSPDVSPQSSPRPPRANNDRLSLLTRLVRKGEKKGLFVEKMPVSIYQVRCEGSHTTTLSSYSQQLSDLFFVFCIDGEG